MMKNIFVYLSLLSGIFLISCNGNHPSVNTKAAITYTCPMPEDSVFSDKPGKCPKCGMDLVPVNEVQTDTAKASVAAAGYTCPMHPNIHSDTPGKCPVCGMDLEPVKTGNEPLSLSLEMLLQPANQSVVANVSMVHLAEREEDLELQVPGIVEYNPDFVSSISARAGGRITKMFVKYRYQKVHAGQPLMEIYSPDLTEAQNNYLFLLKNDAGNKTLIQSAKQKLLLLGVTPAQIQQISHSGKALYSLKIFSNVNGVIFESRTEAMNVISNSSVAPLTLKEGMYVEKGTLLFSVFNPAKARVVLNIFPQHQEMIRAGDKVRIQPEYNPAADFRASVSEIVPYYQQESRTMMARIPFDNSSKNLPVGSRVNAIIFTGYKNAEWLPEEAVLSLGLDKVVFVREQEGFVARKVKTGVVSNHLIQILGGLQPDEAVAANAGFLMDSESFITTKTQMK